MKIGDKLTTIEINFDGSSPSNTEGETKVDPKQLAIQKAKEKAKANVNQAKDNKVEPEVEAQEKPQSKPLEWNPHSKWSGPGRVIQAIKPLRNLSEKFIERAGGRSYSAKDEVLINSDYPAIKMTGNYLLDLQRDLLIAKGYFKELSIVDKTEAGELPKDKNYLLAKNLIDSQLDELQRDGIHNLKGNRSLLLKKLSSPKEEKMYSSLNLLYLYCDKNESN